LAEGEIKKISTTTADANATKISDFDDINNDNNNDNDKLEEEIKSIQNILHLYTSKANEYWKQSRHCLIKAMEQTINTDTDDYIDDTCDCILLDDNQARIRNYNFSLLFSRPIDIVEVVIPDNPTSLSDEQPATKDDKDCNSNSILDQQFSLEERLQNLNKTLLNVFKTTDERMSEVNKGLNKLGLSLYSTHKTNLPQDFKIQFQ